MLLHLCGCVSLRSAKTINAMSASNVLYNVAGIVGSLITSFSILPQIYHVIKRQRTADISYVYQVCGGGNVFYRSPRCGSYSRLTISDPTQPLRVVALLCIRSPSYLRLRSEQCKTTCKSRLHEDNTPPVTNKAAGLGKIIHKGERITSFPFKQRFRFAGWGRTASFECTPR